MFNNIEVVLMICRYLVNYYRLIYLKEGNLLCDCMKPTFF